MIEKECFVKVIFIGRNIGIGRIKATIILALFVGSFYRAKYWHRKARSDDVSSGGREGYIATSKIVEKENNCQRSFDRLCYRK